MGRIPRHEHKNAAKGSKEVTIQIDSSVRLHDDSKRWNFRRGEEDNEDEESDEESDESGSPVAVMADSQHQATRRVTLSSKSLLFEYLGYEQADYRFRILRLS